MTAGQPGMHIHVDGAVKHAVEVSRWRIQFIALFFTMFFLVIAGRLVDLSLAREEAGKRHLGIIAPTDVRFNRAQIKDRNGVLLATNLKTQSLYANAKDVPDPILAAQKIKEVLPELDLATVIKRLSSDKTFVWIKRNLHPSEVEAVNNIGIPGLNFQRDEKRTYPHGTLFSHILGFVGQDGVGLSGLEKEFDCTLRLDKKNRKCGDGEPVKLALDVRVQDIMHRELAKQMEAHKAKAAAGIVMDVTNGEVLSLVSLPDFNGNNPSAVELETTFNHATKALYEMGSTFKTFTMALALESESAKLTDIYDTRKPIKIARYTINDYHGENRKLTFPEVFMYSSNIGTAKIIDKIGPVKQQAFMQKLGLLSPLNIELPEIAYPQYPDNWGRLSMMTISYGHGLSVTPLHVAASMSAMVNGGMYFDPTFVTRDEFEGRRVIKKSTSEIMKKLLRVVVGHKHGTGKKANAKGYFVGGKTGTADKAGGKRYDGRAVVSSFAGVFPMTDPKYVVIAVMDEPKGNKASWGYRTAGWTAAPVVKAVVEQVGPLLGVRPVDDEDEGIIEMFDLNIPQRPEKH
jgi:cell division protein FtsI (penicillin-binding protein 3)